MFVAAPKPPLMWSRNWTLWLRTCVRGSSSELTGMNGAGATYRGPYLSKELESLADQVEVRLEACKVGLQVGESLLLSVDVG